MSLADFPHYKLMFPSDYLEAVDLNGKDVTVTIKDINPRFEFDAVEGKRPTKAEKPLVTFEKAKKGWLLNVTNARAIAKLWGDDPNGWKGKAITVYPTTTRFGRDMVDCVRVRDRKPRPKAPTVKPSENLQIALSMIDQATTLDGVNSLEPRVKELDLVGEDHKVADNALRAKRKQVAEAAMAGQDKA